MLGLSIYIIYIQPSDIDSLIEYLHALVACIETIISEPLKQTIQFFGLGLGSD